MEYTEDDLLELITGDRSNEDEPEESRSESKEKSDSELSKDHEKTPDIPDVSRRSARLKTNSQFESNSHSNFQLLREKTYDIDRMLEVITMYFFDPFSTV